MIKLSGAFQSIRNQISIGLIFKALNALALFFVVRLALELSGDEAYGLWITIFSTITWCSFIEVGVSSGIRNKITQLIESNKPNEAQGIIGSAMTLELLIYSALFGVLVLVGFLVPNSFIDPGIMQPALLFAGILFLGYVFSTVNAVSLANHRAEWPIIVTFIQNLMGLLGLSIGIQLGFDSLLHLGLIFSLSALIAFLTGHFVLYKTRLARLNPSFPSFDFSVIKPHYPTMLRFGVVQFFVLIIFASDHLIILHFLDAASVTEYNIAFRYFNLLNVIFNLILIPFWSAFTAAEARADNAWIKKAIKVLVAIFIGLSILGLTLLAVSPFVYELWLNDLVEVSSALSAVMLLSVLLTMWNYLFVYYLSGIGQIQLYTKLVIVSGSLNIPISIFLVLEFGSVGVIAATCFALLPQAIVLPIQAYKILRE